MKSKACTRTDTVTPAMIDAGGAALRAASYDFWESLDEASMARLLTGVFRAMLVSQNRNANPA
jgi:hypothetical protein